MTICFIQLLLAFPAPYKNYPHANDANRLQLTDYK